MELGFLLLLPFLLKQKTLTEQQQHEKQNYRSKSQSSA